MHSRHFASVLTAASTLVVASASAHISITSGPAFADKTQIVTFGVGHGCEGADTVEVRIEIPQDVASVRALGSDLGPATIERDDAGLVTAVTWTKTPDSVLDEDSHYYELALRIRVPKRNFETLYFPTYQTCEASDGTRTEVGWISTEASDDHDGESEPAPALTILPARYPGWNQFTVPHRVTDLEAWFADAFIVWRDDAAYSVNPATQAQIVSTPGVTELEELAAGDEIWVKY